MTFTLPMFGNFSAMVSIYAQDGTVAVAHGGIEMGQGINTKVSLVGNDISKKYESVVAQWLRCCAANRKVAGSIPDGVIGIFH